MNFKIRDGEQVRTRRAAIGSSTVIAAGDLVSITSGLITKATSVSTKVAWAPRGSASGETVVDISIGNDFTLWGSGDAVFAVSYKGGEYDINDTQTIDYGASSLDILTVCTGEDSGTVDQTTDVEVRINKPLE